MRRRATIADRRGAVGRALLSCALAATALAAGPAAAGAQAIWRLEQPPPPPGAPFKVPLGAPGDLQFWAPNRGLLAVEGNALVPRGLLVYDGGGWRRLAVVCGGSADTIRIAWAGPTEFWTISAPSRPRLGNGTTLCRFKDGQVAASYGTLPQSADPYQPMNAATCRSATDCWFGGPQGRDPSGARVGAFRLRWDGTSLSTSYGPQGRAITDLEPFANDLFESVLVGPGPEQRADADDRDAETVPRLLHRLQDGAFVSEAFEPAPLPGVPPDGTELLAMDAGDQRLWAVGGGAASGLAAPLDGSVPRPPIAVVRDRGDRAFRELPLVAPDGTFAPTDRLVDVAAIPGTRDAWVAVQPFAERRSTNVRARIARIDGTTGAVELVRLPLAGSGRGAASRIACTGVDECWLVTVGGWIFHLSDGSPKPVDRDPAFASLISFRPNESAAQFVPDAPPIDDSLLLAPPPTEIEQPAVAPTVTRRVKPLLTQVRSKLRGTTLTVSFRLARRARVQLIARRQGQVVARSPNRLLRPGRRAVRVRLNRGRWPTKLAFRVAEPGANRGSGDDSITTGGDAVTTGDAVATAVEQRP
jgi:hypothetical protein